MASASSPSVSSSTSFFSFPSSSSSSSRRTLALVSRWWFRLAYGTITSLDLSRRQGISASQFVSTVSLAPNLTSLQVALSGTDLITDAFIALIAQVCPRLERLSLFDNLRYGGAEHHVWTSGGLNSLFQRCTLLKDLSLACPPSVTHLPASIFQLAGLERLQIFSRLIVNLPEEIGGLQALKALHVNAPRLTALPDSLSDLSNLQELSLEGCSDLTSVPDAVGHLLKLRAFHIVDNGFRALELPAYLTLLFSLEELEVGVHLRQLPEDFGNLINLRRMELRCPELTHLPSSLPQLSLLERLVISGGQQMVSLPETIGQLPALRELRISCLSNLQTLPDSIGQLQQLRSLTIDCRGSLRVLPESLVQLSALETLEIVYCESLSSLPGGIHLLTSLQQLDLCECPRIRELPDSISLCKALECVSIEDCRALTNIPRGIQHRVIVERKGETIEDW
ncbi:hypothetical protein CLOP_g600 [Closterium sp. NIES-67]|nr:hypothetical protein CLOP_g600 [Closterium sp. NIES-67]